MFEWYFVMFGLNETAYKNGYYMGKLLFPEDYPCKPPIITVISKNGRFKINE